MMTNSNKKFIVATLVAAVVGCALVLTVWQLFSFDTIRSERNFEKDESASVSPVVRDSYDIDSWNSLLQTTEKPLTFNDYLDLLEERSIDQLMQLAIQIVELEQDNRIQLLQDLLIITLTNKIPETALDLIWKYPWNRHQKLINLVVATLSTAELEKALEIVQSLPQSYQEDALRTMVASQDELSESDWNGLTEDAQVSKHIVRLLREAEAIEQLDQPSVAWDQLLQDDVDNDEQIEVLVQIANARIEGEGFEVLSHFYETLYLTDRFVLESILKKVLDTEPNRAFQTVKTMPYESRNFILPILMEAWANHNPKDAYFAVTEFGYNKSQMPYRKTIDEWAKLDPLDVLESMSQIERVDRSAASSLAVRELAKTNPDEVIQRLGELKKIPGTPDESLESELVMSWSEYDPLEAITWIQETTFADSYIQGDLLFWVLRNYIQVDPDKALEIAFNQPLDSSFVQRGKVGDLFSTLLLNGSNLDKAIALLDDLPDPAINDGFVAVGDRLIEDGRWADAINLANELDFDRKEVYLSVITLSATFRGVHNLIDQLKEMPDNETRKYIASELVREQERRGDALTEQQLKVVRSLLPVSDESSDLNDTNIP
ncbi:MAG: hypothetical protein F4039_08040 [Gammaproteobacteria bacterium]|nr:hypothetical protein [Gammaproteobacteria bacterium]MYK44021.1 hypothetical protein [Gammaproteobacteria bacterium]